MQQNREEKTENVIIVTEAELYTYLHTSLYMLLITK